MEIETLLDYFGGGPATTGLDLGRTGSLLDYMHSGPTGATYLPDLYRLPYPVEDLGVEMELGGLEDWLQREQMERRMGDSLLKWLGHDKV